MSTRVTIGGIPVLMESTITWTNPAGTEPGMAFFDIPMALKEVFMSLSGAPVQLVIQREGGAAEVFDKLFILGVHAGDRPNVGKLWVADRRYWWNRVHIGPKNYNVRRKNGVKRLIDPSATNLDQDIVPEFAYQQNTLNGGVPWKAAALLADVIIGVLANDSFLGLPSIGQGTNISGLEGDDVIGSSIENLNIDAPGNAALLQAMKYLPEFKLTLTNAGDIHFERKNSGFDAAELRDIGKEKWGRGHVEFVDNSAIMPWAVDVIFTREVEVMFYSHEFYSPLNASEADDPAMLEHRDVNSTARNMQNVLVTPDPRILVGRSVCAAGSIVSLDQYIDEIPNVPGKNGASSLRITRKMLRTAALPTMNLWDRFRGDYNIASDPNNDWTGRIAAFIAHFRLTYQINPNWVDRCLAIRNYRVATIDPSTGTRSKGIVYCDYCAVTGQKAFRRRGGGTDAPAFVNAQSFPRPLPSALSGLPIPKITGESHPAPFEIDIIDMDQGVIHFTPKTDLLKNYDTVLPSFVDTNIAPSFTSAGSRSTIPGQPVKSTQIAYNAATKGTTEFPALSLDHNVMVVLTCIPSDPKGQTCRVRVTPNMLGTSLISHDVAVSARKGRGPVYEVRVGAGVETARVPWVNGYEKDIESLFGLPEPAAVEGNGVSNAPPRDPGVDARIDKITVNLKPQSQIEDRAAASLNEIAFAIAARVFAQFADRHMGRMAGKFTPTAQPLGWIDEIRHEVSTAGEVSTSVSFPDQLPQLDFMSLLPADTRAIILREVYRKPT